jgi:hypothetical protein
MTSADLASRKDSTTQLQYRLELFTKRQAAIYKKTVANDQDRHCHKKNERFSL